MKPLTRRLQRLEQWASSQRNDEGETLADVLRKRIQAYAGAEGVPFEDQPARQVTDHRGRALTVAEILRGR